jgi:hypothetical protein
VCVCARDVVCISDCNIAKFAACICVLRAYTHTYTHTHAHTCSDNAAPPALSRAEQRRADEQKQLALLEEVGYMCVYARACVCESLCRLYAFVCVCVCDYPGTHCPL